MLPSCNNECSAVSLHVMCNVFCSLHISCYPHRHLSRAFGEELTQSSEVEVLKAAADYSREWDETDTKLTALVKMKFLLKAISNCGFILGAQEDASALVAIALPFHLLFPCFDVGSHHSVTKCTSCNYENSCDEAVPMVSSNDVCYYFIKCKFYSCLCLLVRN